MGFVAAEAMGPAVIHVGDVIHGCGVGELVGGPYFSYLVGVSNIGCLEGTASFFVSCIESCSKIVPGVFNCGAFVPIAEGISEDS